MNLKEMIYTFNIWNNQPVCFMWNSVNVYWVLRLEDKNLGNIMIQCLIWNIGLKHVIKRIAHDFYGSQGLIIEDTQPVGNQSCIVTSHESWYK